MISHKVIPNKSFGQNFLADKNFLAKIVLAGDLQADDTVLEIGAGTGVLTVELAQHVKHVVAYEIDKKLIRVLQENLAGYKNVEIIDADILKTPSFIPPLSGGETSSAPPDKEGIEGRSKYKLVANIPYNITSKILEKFLSAKDKPSLIVLLVQKEVAERICVKSGHQSVLSVSVQFYGQPSIVAKVPAGAFWPAPKVDSAILKIVVGPPLRPPLSGGRNVASPDKGEIRPQTERGSGGWQGRSEKEFFHLVKAGFANKRKMLKNNLKEYGEDKIKTALIGLGLNEKIRAEDLNVEQWLLLSTKLQIPNHK